jgi:hypothetical protein
MVMKYNVLILIILLFALSTCKKYPEGGFVNQTRKHLFGGNDVGDSKTWKLKLYEVNGVDSTYLIQGANSIPDFYDKFVTFTYKDSDPTIKYQASTYTQNYSGTISKKGKDILVAYDWLSEEDSTQCKSINNIFYCQRNLLFPEFLRRNPKWEISKLTKNELVLSIKLTNSYKIILSQ